MEASPNKIIICICKDCSSECPCRERGYCSKYCAHCKGDCGKPKPIKIEKLSISKKIQEKEKIGKKYYALLVGGTYVKVHYTLNNEDWVEPKANLALAWVEEKDRYTHYFLFKLCMIRIFMLILIFSDSYLCIIC